MFTLYVPLAVIVSRSRIGFPSWGRLRCPVLGRLRCPGGFSAFFDVEQLTVVQVRTDEHWVLSVLWLSLAGRSRCPMLGRLRRPGGFFAMPDEFGTYIVCFEPVVNRDRKSVV